MVTLLVQPDVHRAGTQCMQKLREIDLTAEIAQKWPSIFTGISTIINRQTIPHRDGGQLPAAFDLLVSLGSYSSSTLDIHDIRLKLQYNPGTVVFLCGNILKHGVNHWDRGDRVCYAHFLQGRVLEHLVVETPTWVKLKDLQNSFKDSLLTPHLIIP